MTSMIDEILAQIPADDLAAQLGTDPDIAMDAARKALPALLGGLSSNVTAGGSDTLGNALQRDHDGSLLDRLNPLAVSDAADGQKIIGHIFGSQQDRVVGTLGATSLGGTETKAAPEDEGGGLGSILGKLTGKKDAGGSGGGGGLGGLLGGLLGGEVEKGKSSMPELAGMFDILGGGELPSSPSRRPRPVAWACPRSIPISAQGVESAKTSVPRSFRSATTACLM